VIFSVNQELMMRKLLLCCVMTMLSVAAVRAEEQSISLDKLPKAVLDSVKGKYPKAELVEAIQEEDGGEIKFEVTIKEAGKQIDLTLNAAGIIESIEKELGSQDLPKVVTDALEKKYPKAVHKKIEAVFEVEDGKEELEFYEVTLETAAKETLEVKIDDEGEIEDDEKPDDDEWTNDFSAEKKDLTATGRNPFFILEPGYQLVLEEGNEILTITVLDETKLVDGVETRVVEERESKGGKLVEVSRNYFAISKRTNSVYYFGEDVDMYKDGKVTGHGGSWLSGVNNARFGLAMPGLPLLEAKYQQEVAPGVAMDRSEIVSLSETVKVPAGDFKNCLKVAETTPLEPEVEEEKRYAPGVGLLTDGSLKLVRYGKVELKK